MTVKIENSTIILMSNMAMNGYTIATILLNIRIAWLLNGKQNGFINLFFYLPGTDSQGDSFQCLHCFSIIFLPPEDTNLFTCKGV